MTSASFLSAIDGLADRFIEANAKVTGLSERIELLTIAEGLRSEWSEAIECDIKRLAQL
jgi:hypothetical protein